MTLRPNNLITQQVERMRNLNKEYIIINKDIRRKSFSFDIFLSLKWCYFALSDHQL